MEDEMELALEQHFGAMGIDDHMLQHSDESSSDTLEHHGVKGMKWGVRQAEKGASRTEKKEVKQDNKWAQKALVPRTAINIHNYAAEKMNNGVLDSINSKPEYSGDADLIHPSPLRDQYHAEVQSAWSKAISDSASEIIKSPSGKYEVEAWAEKDELLPRVRVRPVGEVQHADGVLSIEYDVRRDAKGHVISLSPVDSTLQQGEAFAEDVLTHFGVKGMRWGVRNDGGTPSNRGPIRRGITKANVATDAGHEVIKKGEEKLIFLPKEKRDKAANATQARVLGVARDVNRDERFRGKDIKRNPALKKEYFDEIKKKAVGIYKEELGVARVEAVSDLLEGVVNTHRNSMAFKAPSNRIQHADNLETLLTLLFDTDELGQIVGVRIGKDSLSQSEERSDNEIMHFGVKGMRWGVRNDKNAKNTPTDVNISIKKPGTYVRTTGGKNLAPSQDAIDAAVGKQKARGSTTDALSNKELQAVVTRMNLEQQYSRLSADSAVRRQGKGKKFLRKIFGLNKHMDEVVAFGNSPSGKLVKKNLNKTETAKVVTKEGKRIASNIDKRAAARAAARLATGS